MHRFQRLRFYVLLCSALLLTLIAFLGPVLAPEDPNAIDLGRLRHPPDDRNLFGTDILGRDMLSRVLYGARNSFALTFMMVLIVAFIGTAVGITAGYIGGAVNSAVMQISDVMLAFPTVVFAIAVCGLWGPGIYRTLAALAMVSWAKYARMTGGLIAEIRSREYVTQALFAGARWYHILLKYLLPNILPQIVVITTSDIGEMMIMLSMLSFLGLVNQPYAPEWGSMLADNRGFLMTYPYLFIFPAMALLLIVVVFNLLGDSLRDILDPKEKR